MRRSIRTDELLNLQVEMQRLLGELSDEICRASLEGKGGWNPRVDLSEDEKEFLVVAEVPGVNAGHLQVVCQDGFLTLSGEKKAEVLSGKKVCYLCLERSYGRFRRMIPLNVTVDVGSARATLKNGILTISLPKLPNRRKAEWVIPIEG
ncbi:MAG: Hsp20/alpha crystallin family protein [Acidobacteriota bacterium]